MEGGFGVLRFEADVVFLASLLQGVRASMVRHLRMSSTRG